MQNTDIRELLEKFKAGTITSEELTLLETWYLQWQPEALEVSDEELQAVKDEVWRSMDIPPLRAFRTRLWPRIAAAASLLLLLSVSVYYFLQRSVQVSRSAQVAAHDTAYDFKPGGNKALLTLSNGRQIVLTDAANGKLADQGPATINKLANGQLVYSAPDKGSGKASAAIIYNTMTTPRGGQYHVVLSDGTQVWLNAASSITYPVTFAEDERKVMVNGEVYFEVAPDESKPFNVSVGNQEITVLGTSFNVKGYADDAGVSTTLVTGSVRVRNVISGQSGLLRPGQQARILKDQAQISISTVNAENAVSWKNGYFLFDDQDIESIMKTMSRWYDVDVEYNNYNKQERFGGTFSRSSNISDILHSLEQVGHIHFKIQSKKIIVTD